MGAARRQAGVLSGRPRVWAESAGDFISDSRDRWRRGLSRWSQAEAERRRLFLWLPVAYSIGIALYFMADGEPAPWVAPLFAVAAIVAAFLLRGFWRARAAAIFCAAIFCGLSVGSFRTMVVMQPVLGETVIGPLAGFVRSVEDRVQGPRAVVEVVSFAGLPRDRQPGRVRVTFRKGVEIQAGTMIYANARLVPPPEPARPGGYDFARDAFFNGIGAVGSVLGPVTVSRVDADSQPAGARLAAWIDVRRNILTKRIIQAAGGPEQAQGGEKGGAGPDGAGETRVRGQEAAFVAALVTGKRGQIADETNEALRASGIYHVVSIGGFHMTLVAGTFFFLTRLMLALIPGLAVGYPIRKIAALVGIAGAGAYCIFSGAGIDTQRALFVTLIVMGAVLAERPALSMRNLALSALVCLTLQPETMLGPSFQMSFAGVAALIALFERWENADPAGTAMPLREGGPLRISAGAGGNRGGGAGGAGRLYRVAVMSIVTTIVAMLATGPFSTYHFQTFNPWGILGNAFGLPIVELVVMPLSFIAVALYPLGLDGPFWYLAGLASVPVLEGSRIVAGFTGSIVTVPAFGPGVLTLLVAGLLWICLWSTPLRWIGILPAAAGIAIAAAPARPDVLIDREGRGTAVRAADGRFVILGRPSGFVVEQWLRADGDGRRAEDATLKDNVACDRLGCVTTLANGRSIAFARDPQALAEDCRRAYLLITPRQAPPDCAAPHVIDRRDLDRLGAMTLTFKGNGLIADGMHRNDIAGRTARQNPEGARPADSAPADGIGKSGGISESRRPWQRTGP